MLLTEITLSFNLFCALTINDKIKTSATHSVISFSVSCLFAILLQPMCCTKIPDVSSFKIGVKYVYICFRVPPNGLNRVLYLFNFELNSFFWIPLIVLNPIIYNFLPNFTVLFTDTIDDVVFFIWWWNRSLSGYLLITGDGLCVFHVAKLFICRSILWASPFWVTVVCYKLAEIHF